MAYQATSDELWQLFNSRYVPTAKTWKLALEGRDYQSVDDTYQAHLLMKSLPVQFDQNGRIWISPNSKSIVVFQDPKTASLPLLFTHSTQTTFTKEWQPYGHGWPGFEKLLVDIDKKRSTWIKKALPQLTKRGPQYDPREIRY